MVFGFMTSNTKCPLKVTGVSFSISCHWTSGKDILFETEFNSPSPSPYDVKKKLFKMVCHK